MDFKTFKFIDSEEINLTDILAQMNNKIPWAAGVMNEIFKKTEKSRERINYIFQNSSSLSELNVLLTLYRNMDDLLDEDELEIIHKYFVEKNEKVELQQNDVFGEFRIIEDEDFYFEIIDFLEKEIRTFDSFDFLKLGDYLQKKDSDIVSNWGTYSIIYLAHVAKFEITKK